MKPANGLTNLKYLGVEWKYLKSSIGSDYISRGEALARLESRQKKEVAQVLNSSDINNNDNDRNNELILLNKERESVLYEIEMNRNILHTKIESLKSELTKHQGTTNHLHLRHLSFSLALLVRL